MSEPFLPFNRELKSFNSDIIIGTELSNMVDKQYNTHTSFKDSFKN